MPTKAADLHHVPAGLDFFGRVMGDRQRLWVRIGNLESRFLAEELARVAIDRPIYVTGLARSGTTKLLEIASSHAGVASHRYSDFPPIYTPFWWNRLLERIPRRAAEPVERTHRDGIMVTPESPEAFEEVLWMTFFPAIHGPGASDVLDAATRNPPFERFYRDHVRKLLLVRGGARYLAKGNYNVARLAYLRRLFPDARFVIPVREPAAHIDSLMKQHALFVEAETANPRVLDHMRRVGHFEFGLDRRAINFGDDARVRAVEEAWAGGAEVLGWARYWSLVYGFLADLLAADAGLARAALVVRYEDLCADPEAAIRGMLAHCDLLDPDPVVERHAGEIRAPSYYRSRLTDADRDIIRRETGATAARLGYA